VFLIQTITQNPNNSKQDPISSFNLSLTDQQRSQKDGVVLPYTKVQDSVIDYIVDKDDDFDSDDPDDDLDI
jgi:Elongator subunit Iki1